jgi:hypothetical protein
MGPMCVANFVTILDFSLNECFGVIWTGPMCFTAFLRPPPFLLHWEEWCCGNTPDQSHLARYLPSDVYCKLHVFKHVHIPTACPLKPILSIHLYAWSNTTADEFNSWTLILRSSKSLYTLKFQLKSDRTNRHFTWRCMCFCMHFEFNLRVTHYILCLWEETSFKPKLWRKVKHILSPVQTPSNSFHIITQNRVNVAEMFCYEYVS